MNTRREELAWAAGFFDGEGYTSAKPERRDIFIGLRLGISQSEEPPFSLKRFREAVSGIGTIHGPYLTMHKPRYTYSANGVEAQAVFAMLASFLGPEKFKQGADKIRIWSAYRQKWQKCAALGHRIQIGVNASGGPKRYCMDCVHKTDKSAEALPE